MTIQELDKLIPIYASNKAEMESYKTLCDKDNKRIKQIMINAKNLHYITGGYKADCIVSNRTTMNEETLLSIFSVPSFTDVTESYGIIKSKPYIDFDALEKAIYDGKLTTEQIAELNKAKEVKEVVTLKVTKIEAEGEMS